MTLEYRIKEEIIQGTWELDADVGLSNIPNRRLCEAKQKVHTLNLMVVGPAGCGKATLINSLCCRDVIPENRARRPDQFNTSNFNVYDARLEEGSVHVNLNVTEVIGYEEAQGDRLKSLVNDLKAHLENPLKEQLAKEYTEVSAPYCSSDKVYHALLFCMSPSGSSYLSSKDAQFLEAVKELVFVIPIICKADCYTEEELLERKARVRGSLKAIGIRMYPADRDHYYEDVYEEIEERFPFATIASTALSKDRNGDLIRARKYPWGQIDIDSNDHSDFGLLQKILFQSFFTKFHVHAKDIVYHNYRQTELPIFSKKNSVEQVTEDLQNGKYALPIQKSSIQSDKIDLIAQKAMARLRISSESIQI